MMAALPFKINEQKVIILDTTENIYTVDSYPTVLILLLFHDFLGN